MKFPQYAVSKWIGHSITVSGRHYANDVPDELFAKAAGMSDEGNSSAHHNAHMKVHEQSRNNQKHKRATGKAGSPKSGVCENFPDISGILTHDQKWSRGESNPRPLAKNKGKTGNCERGAPLCAPPVAQANPDNPQLAELIAAWPSLPAAVRRGIMAMVEEMRRE